MKSEGLIRVAALGLIAVIFSSAAIAQNMGTLDLYHTRIESKGYTAPKGYEWMVPTDVFMVMINHTQPNSSPSDRTGLKPMKFYLFGGRSAEEATRVYNRFNTHVNIDLGDRIRNGVRDDTTTVHCAFNGRLGWVAYVQLFDENADNVRLPAFPKNGVGVMCGARSEQEAIASAFRAAKKQLNSNVGGFSVHTGVNSLVDFDGWPNAFKGQNFSRSWIGFPGNCQASGGLIRQLPFQADLNSEKGFVSAVYKISEVSRDCVMQNRFNTPSKDIAPPVFK